MLNDHQIQRYARQLVLNKWGARVQERLIKSRALVVGLGGLGSPVAYYLAAAGVGNLTLVDGDRIELSNLNRQILHSTRDIGRTKAESAREKIEALNPDCRVNALEIRLTSKNSKKYFRSADIVLDCTDGFVSKYLLNDAAVLYKKPLIHAGVLAFGGQVMTIQPGKSACLRCIFPEPPPIGAIPTSVVVGILGAVAGAIGLLQANEAIKFLARIGSPLANRILTFDALEMRWCEVKAQRNPRCPVCGVNPKIKILREIIQKSPRRLK